MAMIQNRGKLSLYFSLSLLCLVSLSTCGKDNNSDQQPSKAEENRKAVIARIEGSWVGRRTYVSTVFTDYTYTFTSFAEPVRYNFGTGPGIINADGAMTLKMVTTPSSPSADEANSRASYVFHVPLGSSLDDYSVEFWVYQIEEGNTVYESTPDKVKFYPATNILAYPLLSGYTLKLSKQ